jgi:hypothetical protein
MFKVGDLVEIRSKEEILRTLDRGARLEALPFMPEMLAYCGQRFKIYRHAYKTCDTVSGRYIGLRAQGCVHLNMRCDGAAFDGCQAGCLLFWKTAWLKPVGANVDPGIAAETEAAFRRAVASAMGCTEDDVRRATRKQVGGKTLYVCQATALLEYTEPLKWWNPKQYLDAYRSGNRSAKEIVKGLTFLFYAYGARANSARLGAPARWLYNRARPIWGGIEFPRRPDLLTNEKSSPRRNLGLKPGDMVRIKPYHEILATLDKKGSNRGLMFDAELVPYCGKVFRVKRFVERFVNEADGEFTELKTPAVILDGVVCTSRFSGQRMFCPREIYGWWREVWLERVEDPVVGTRAAPNVATAELARTEVPAE